MQDLNNKQDQVYTKTVNEIINYSPDEEIEEENVED